MGRNNADFQASTAPREIDWEEHNRRKGAWSSALHQEHGRSVKSQDKAETDLKNSGEY